jgi:hypothetical protein
MTIEDAAIEPVSCTLVHSDLKNQRERWVSLGLKFGRGSEETADGIRLLFADNPAVEKELQALVATENECCSWAAWAVEHDGGVLVMTARSKGEGIATLHAMFEET